MKNEKPKKKSERKKTEKKKLLFLIKIKEKL